ncbi:MAG: nucleotide sugar dehydrogenase [Desulfocucumaceae bacterium]
MINELTESKVAVMGLGYVGLSLAAALSHRGARVFGVDRSEKLVRGVNAGISPIKEPGMGGLVKNSVISGRLSAHTDASVAGQADVIIMAVGTPLDECYQPDMRQLLEAADDICPFLRSGQTIILKSTVPPGTTRLLAGRLAEGTGLEPGRDLHLACCPERLAEGRIIKDLETIPVVVGGITREDTERAANFWSGLGWKVIKVSGPEEAEMIKMADNLWIDLNIALSNELCMLCHRLGVDVLEVINGANTLPKGMGNVNLLFPGPGVGGSCLVKDPWFVHYLGRDNGVPLFLPSAGRQINEGMPGFIVKVVEERLAGANSSLKGQQICVMGLSFKQNTGDTRFSPSVPLVKLLSAAGSLVRVYDPWVDAELAGQLLGSAAEVEIDLRSAIKGCQAVIFMVGHRDFPRASEFWRGILEKDCLLVDCRYIFDAAAMTGAGINYCAPGRRVLSGLCQEKELCRDF